MGGDEQEVERDARQHGREHRRPDAADERDDHDQQLIASTSAVIDSSEPVAIISSDRRGPPTRAVTKPRMRRFALSAGPASRGA